MANTLKFGNGEWYGKKDTILAYNDLNSNYKPLLFNFSRASKATVVNKDGLIEEVGSGQPRVDYLNNTKGAMLLEPSRSNITYPSENFSNQLQGASATFGTLISPDGTLNGSTIASTVDGAYKGWHKTYNLTEDTYTFSMFVKYYNSQWISIYRIGQAISRFDVKNGVFGNNPSNLKSVNYGNGWYRLEFTFTAASGTNWLYIYPSSDIGETSSTGDGLYIWGGQLEVGSYATSAIFTSGSAVTRVKDECSQTVPDGVIGQTEGTMYVEADVTFDSRGGRLMLIGQTGNFIEILGKVNGKVNCFVRTSSTQADILSTSTYSSGDNLKIAFGYKENDFALYINGTQQGVDSSGVVPTLINKIIINNYTASGYDELQKYKDIQLYNTRLSNSELAALTTI